jgi:DNA-binding HxlR family transcriptional regulator
MQPYGQYCPVARAGEIRTDRWTVFIVRELLADVSHFNELERGLPRLAPCRSHPRRAADAAY